MTLKIGTRRLASFLIAKGLLPKNCQNVEILIGLNTALKIRYEVLVDAAVLAEWGASFSEAAAEQATDDERNRLSFSQRMPEAG